MDFKTLNAVLSNVARRTWRQTSVMIRGGHGIEVEALRQLARTLEMKVVERRISQMMEGDLMGLLSTDGESTSWNHPDGTRRCRQPSYSFDEVDRGDQQVRQGICRLVTAIASMA